MFRNTSIEPQMIWSTSMHLQMTRSTSQEPQMILIYSKRPLNDLIYSNHPKMKWIASKHLQASAKCKITPQRTLQIANKRDPHQTRRPWTQTSSKWPQLHLLQAPMAPLQQNTSNVLQHQVATHMSGPITYWNAKNLYCNEGRTQQVNGRGEEPKQGAALLYYSTTKCHD